MTRSSYERVQQVFDIAGARISRGEPEPAVLGFMLVGIVNELVEEVGDTDVLSALLDLEHGVRTDWSLGGVH